MKRNSSVLRTRQFFGEHHRSATGWSEATEDGHAWEESNRRR